MRRSALAAALVLVLGTGAMAIAQTGGGDPPEDPGAIAAQSNSFGECVSNASEAEVANPTELCAHLKPGSENRGEDEKSSGGDPADGTHAAACKDRPKEGGEFGRCVSERASEFGRCVDGKARAGEKNPAAACDELKPGGDARGGKPESTPGGKPESTPGGQPESTPGGQPEGTPNGKPEGTPGGQPEITPSGQPEGTPGGGQPEGTPNGKPGGTPGGPGS
jgi:hypothetical protein